MCSVGVNPNPLSGRHRGTLTLHCQVISGTMSVMTAVESRGRVRTYFLTYNIKYLLASHGGLAASMRKWVGITVGLVTWRSGQRWFECSQRLGTCPVATHAGKVRLLGRIWQRSWYVLLLSQVKVAHLPGRYDEIADPALHTSCSSPTQTLGSLISTLCTLCRYSMISRVALTTLDSGIVELTS